MQERVPWLSVFRRSMEHIILRLMIILMAKKGRNISGSDKVADKVANKVVNKVANKVVNKVAKRIGMERTLIMKLVLMRRNSVLSTI